MRFGLVSEPIEEQRAFTIDSNAALSLMWLRSMQSSI